MAIVKCPECQNDISNKAYSCPHCGYVLRQNNIIINNKKNEGCFLKTLNLGCIFILVIIGLMVLTVALNMLFLKH